MKAQAIIALAILAISMFGIALGAVQPTTATGSPGEFSPDEYTLALWHFNEGEGQMVYDESAHNNHGTLGSTSDPEARDPSWTAGFTGQPGDYALDFVDWYDHVRITDNPDDSLDLLCGEQFTIEFWTYVRHVSRPDRGNGNHWNSWIAKRIGSEPGYVITQAQRFNDPWLNAYFHDGSGYCSLFCRPTPTNQWIHLMFTYDGQYLRLYFNDVLQEMVEVGHHYVGDSARPLTIGKSLEDDTPWRDAVDGIIDEVRISSIVRIPLDAIVEIDPDTLNLKSNGQWITAYVELPDGYSVTNIDLSTILLNDMIPVDLEAPVSIGDYDLDCIPDLMVKFSRAAVVALVGAVDLDGDTGNERYVTLTIIGTVAGRSFQGTDTIRVVKPG